MRVVYKYPISRVGGSFTTYQGYVPRYVGVDVNGQVCIWLEVDTNNYKLPIQAEVKVVGTGQEFDFLVIGRSNIFLDSIDENGFEFVGTAIESNGLVWHVYLR